MSVRLLREVRAATGLTGWPRAILLVLADVANDGGRSWWSRRRIADMAGCSIRTVSRALAILEASGWITRDARHRPDGGRTSSVVRIRPAEAVARDARAQMSLRLFRAIPSVPPRASVAHPPRASVAQQEATTSDQLKHQQAEPSTPPPEPARAAPGYPGGDQPRPQRHSLRRPTRANVEAILLRGLPGGRHAAPIRDRTTPHPPLAQVVLERGLAGQEEGPAEGRAHVPLLQGAG